MPDSAFRWTYRALEQPVWTATARPTKRIPRMAYPPRRRSGPLPRHGGRVIATIANPRKPGFRVLFCQSAGGRLGFGTHTFWGRDHGCRRGRIIVLFGDRRFLALALDRSHHSSLLVL